MLKFPKINKKINEIDIKFSYGIGDNINFARVSKLFVDENIFRINVATDWKCQCLFEKINYKDTFKKFITHPCDYPLTVPLNTIQNDNNTYLWNKVGRWFAAPPFERFSIWKYLWNKLKNTKLDLGTTNQSNIDNYLKEIKKPIFGFQPRSVGNYEKKSLSPQMEKELIEKLSLKGSVILLCWNEKRNYSINNFYQWNNQNLLDTYYLMTKLDAFIGIDSGPSHFCGMIDTPSVIIWLDKDKTKSIKPPQRLGKYIDFLHPAYFMIPSYNTIHLCHTHPLNEIKSKEYNIVETDNISTDFILKNIYKYA